MQISRQKYNYFIFRLIMHVCLKQSSTKMTFHYSKYSLFTIDKKYFVLKSINKLMKIITFITVEPIDQYGLCMVNINTYPSKDGFTLWRYILLNFFIFKMSYAIY